MLKIRQAQMDRLQEQVVEKNFVRRVIEFVRAEFPQDLKKYPEERWQSMVVNGLSRARRYGISYEASSATFVALMFHYAPNFDEYAPIHAILTDPDVPPDARINLLDDCTLDEDWAVVQARADLNAWTIYFGA